MNMAIKLRPPSLSELTRMIFNLGLTHLGSEAYKYQLMSISKQRYFISVTHSKSMLLKLKTRRLRVGFCVTNINFVSEVFQ